MQDELKSIPSPEPQEVIVARATAPGPAAIAVIRIDGAGTDAVVRRLFRPTGRVHPVDRSRQMIHGRWLDDDGEVIDDGLCVFFRAPASFTGNDAAEFYCHGGLVPVRRLIEAAVAAGARPAEPGEFTRRAFLNGRMDLTQAEAVADLINAQTDAAARAAHRQLAGCVSERIATVRELLIQLSAEIEARLDFPEEELGDTDMERLNGMFDEAAGRLDRLLATRRRGRLLREGARVVLVGRPNAGKSSLLNALARSDRAIVTPHPGTTRDAIECTIDLGGVPLVLIDTAGLRASDDPVERIGIERTLREIERADLVVLVHDATLADVEPDELATAGRRPDLVLWNKSDLPEAAPAPQDVLAVSALRGDGLDEFERTLVERLHAYPVETGGELAIGMRHGELLEHARRALAEAHSAFLQGLSGEFTMVDLRQALDALSEVLGVETGEAVLDRIFSQFCLGK